MIIGTAGHIDHGKSALVTALTGRPVDRLAEEKLRGITIDLNFAPLELAGLPPAGIVDVPGHEDFVRTMVAGASGVDLVLLVIDLGEGPRPQTHEHLAILEQLQVPRGIPVFTKADLVEPEWAELVVADFETRLRVSSIRWEAPAVVSSRTGHGIAALRDRLREAMAAQTGRSRKDRFRMPIDRVFSVAGVGTIVTGTTWSGSVAVGGQVRILPGGIEARVRSIEAYGTAQTRAEPGVRTALGLVGVERAEMARGLTAVDGPWEESTAIDVEIELLPTAHGPLRGRARVRVHLGTAEVLARVQPRQPIEPGQRGLARLALETPLVVRGDDRFVLRSYSPVVTIGGGRVVDPLPPRRAPWPPGLGSIEPVERTVALVARRRDGIQDRAAFQLLGPGAADLVRDAKLTPVGEWWVLPDRLTELARTAIALIKGHHQSAPTEAGLSLETLRQGLGAPTPIAERVVTDLGRKGAVKAHGGLVAISGFSPQLVGGAEGVARVVAVLVAAGLEVPTGDEVAAQLGFPSAIPLLRKAIEEGTVVAIDRERFASTQALDRFREALHEIGTAGEITPAALRDRLGLSRKFLIPLLEWADRQGITRRVGDTRVLVQSGR